MLKHNQYGKRCKPINFTKKKFLSARSFSFVGDVKSAPDNL